MYEANIIACFSPLVEDYGVPADTPHATRAELFRVSLTISLLMAVPELPADTGFGLCGSRSHTACVSNRWI